MSYSFNGAPWKKWDDVSRKSWTYLAKRLILEALQSLDHQIRTPLLLLVRARISFCG